MGYACEIRAIDDQIRALETEALDQWNLFQYFKLQSRAGRLTKEQRILQNRWNRAMTELAICRLVSSLSFFALSLYPYTGHHLGESARLICKKRENLPKSSVIELLVQRTFRQGFLSFVVRIVILLFCHSILN